MTELENVHRSSEPPSPAPVKSSNTPGVAVPNFTASSYFNTNVQAILPTNMTVDSSLRNSTFRDFDASKFKALKNSDGYRQLYENYLKESYNLIEVGTSKTLDRASKRNREKDFARFIESLHELGYSVPLNVARISKPNVHSISTTNLHSASDLANENCFMNASFNPCQYSNSRLDNIKIDYAYDHNGLPKDANSNFSRAPFGSEKGLNFSFNDDMHGLSNSKSSRNSSNSDVNALLDALITPMKLRRGRESAV